MNPSDPNNTPPKDNFGAKPEESAELQDVENSLESNTTAANSERQPAEPIQDIKPPAAVPTSGSEPVIIPADDSADSVPTEVPQPAPTVEPMTSPSPDSDTTPKPSQAEEPLPPPAAPSAAVGSFGSNTATPNTPKQKKSKKALIAVLGIVLIAALAVGGYLYWQSTQNTAQPSSNEAPAAEAEAEADTTPIDTADGLDAEIETIEAEIDQIDDSEFQDQTLSDETLEQQ